MKRLRVGLTVAAVLGVVACASEEIDQTPLLGGMGGNAASGGNHVGGAGRAGSSASGTPGGSGPLNQGGTAASSAGSSSSGAGVTGVGAGGFVSGAGGVVGASGSVGTGGSGGSAASGGSAPVFESGTCASSPSMSLSYKQASNNSKQITALYQFSNTTDTPLPLAQLKIRYFFSNEETSGWSTAIYDAKLEGGTGNYRPITDRTIAVSPLGTTLPEADSYIEISFGSSPLSVEKGATGTVSWDLQPKSYNPPDQVQTNDYSYNAAAVAFTVWDHVVIYQGNTLVWGCTPKEPGGSGGAGGAGAGGAPGGSAGTGGSGASNGGSSGAGMGGTAGANAGTGGDATNGGATSGGAGMDGTTSGGTGGASGGVSNGGASGNPLNAGSGTSSAGNSGNSGSI